MCTLRKVAEWHPDMSLANDDDVDDDNSNNDADEDNDDIHIPFRSISSEILNLPVSFKIRNIRALRHPTQAIMALMPTSCQARTWTHIITLSMVNQVNRNRGLKSS